MKRVILYSKIFCVKNTEHVFIMWKMDQWQRTDSIILNADLYLQHEKNIHFQESQTKAYSVALSASAHRTETR